MTRQRGFTLIEVLVAFAIFALATGALYEIFAGAVRRNLQADVREQEVLIAQSLLSRQRVLPQPWSPEASGRSREGWSWHVEVAPYETATDAHSPWHAVAVTIHVAREEAEAKEVVLRSIELARTRP